LITDKRGGYMSAKKVNPSTFLTRGTGMIFDDIARAVVGSIYKDVLTEIDVQWPNSATAEKFPLCGNKLLGGTHVYGIGGYYRDCRRKFQKAMISEALLVSRYQKKIGIGKAVIAMGGSFKSAINDVKVQGPVLKGDVEGWYIFRIGDPRRPMQKDGIETHTLEEVHNAVRESGRELSREDIKEVEGFCAVRLF